MGHMVNDANFGAEVLGAKEPVLVDFWAEWCPPCKAMDPILDDLSVELAGRVKIVKLDVETNPGIVTRYNLRAANIDDTTLARYIAFRPGSVTRSPGPDWEKERREVAAFNAAAPVPLLVSADLEGSRMSLPGGAQYPNPLALAAIDDVATTT